MFSSMSKVKRFNPFSILPVLKASGLTIREFPVQRGLSVAILYRWHACREMPCDIWFWQM